MAGADLAVIATYLKDKYGPAIVNQLPDDTPIRSEFHSDKTQSWYGNEVTYPIRVNRSRAVIATSEGGKLPTANAQKHEKVHIPLRFMHARTQFSGQALKLSESNEGAWARVMSLEMDQIVQDLAMQCEFYYAGWGTGIRAFVNTDPVASTTITVDSPMGIAGALHGNRFLNEDERIAFVSPTGTIRAGGTRKITEVNPDGTTITIDAAPDASVADNDLIVKAYGDDASITIDNTEYMKAPMGLLGMLDDATYVSNFHGISRDQHVIFRTPVISAVGALSLDVLQRGFDLSSQLGNAKISALWCHHSVRRAYLALLEADRRYTGGDLKSPDGGTKAVKGEDITYGTVPVKVAWAFPYGFLVGVDKRHMVRYVNTEGEWMSEDGAVLSRVQDEDAYEATFRVFENAHYERPNAGIRWDGINATAIVAHVM